MSGNETQDILSARKGCSTSYSRLLHKNRVSIRALKRRYYPSTFIDYDDMQSLCMYGLWKAINTYKIDRSKGSFEKYAYYCMHNQLDNEITKKNRAKKRQRIEVSLNATIGDGENSFIDLIQSNEINPENFVIFNEIFSILKDRIKKKDFKVIEYMMEYGSISEVAGMIGITPNGLRIKLKSIKKRINKILDAYDNQKLLYLTKL